MIELGISNALSRRLASFGQAPVVVDLLLRSYGSRVENLCGKQISMREERRKGSESFVLDWKKYMLLRNMDPGGRTCFGLEWDLLESCGLRFGGGVGVGGESHKT